MLATLRSEHQADKKTSGIRIMVSLPSVLAADVCAVVPSTPSPYISAVQSFTILLYCTHTLFLTMLYYYTVLYYIIVQYYGLYDWIAPVDHPTTVCGCFSGIFHNFVQK